MHLKEERSYLLIYLLVFFLSLHHRFFWTLRFQTEGEIPRRYSYLFAILRRNWRAYWSQPVAGRRESRVYAGTTGHVLRVYPCRRKRWRSAYCMYTLYFFDYCEATYFLFLPWDIYLFKSHYGSCLSTCGKNWLFVFRVPRSSFFALSIRLEIFCWKTTIFISVKVKTDSREEDDNL